LAVCLYLDPLVTAAVGVLLVPVGVVQLWLNRRIHQNEEFFGEAQGRSKGFLQSIIAENPSPLLSPEARQFESEKVKRSGELQDAQAAYLYRINAAAHAEAIGHIGLTLALVAALGWLLFEYFTGATRIAEVAVFLFALRFLLQAGKSVLVSLAVFTRHFGRVRDVYEVINA
jgi:ABC-type multidrug transport system fused ATPase/permease subunit